MSDNPKPLRLGVNIDHVATIRNARGGTHPEPVAAALLAISAGADGITAHLREDRRHITDDDIAAIRQAVGVPLKECLHVLLCVVSGDNFRADYYSGMTMSASERQNGVSVT